MVGIHGVEHLVPLANGPRVKRGQGRRRQYRRERSYLAASTPPSLPPSPLSAADNPNSYYND